MKVLFWNTHNNVNINDYLECIIMEKECDIIVLAEYSGQLDQLCNTLSLSGEDYLTIKNVGCPRIKIVAKHNYKFEIIRENSYYSIHSIDYFQKKYLMVALHFPSNMYSGDEERIAIATILIRDIEEVEEIMNNSNTFIIGDFNANPFDKVCVNASSFHGIPNRNIANKNKRSVNKINYKMFYNPMWNLMGDFSEPNGTYYYTKSGVYNCFWNIFDQILLRPQLANYLVDDTLEIISKTRNKSLVTDNGIPDKKNASDHLPILAEIREEKLL